MWIKLDDGFATHPKLLTAGPFALALQVRAICYASQHQTDGVLPFESVPYLTVGFPEADWPATMVKHRLWDVDNTCYRVHDYLEWNMSKREYELFIKKKRKAGKKGMQSRWGKGLPGIAPVITDAITKPYHPISTSIATLNPPNPSESGPNPKSEKQTKLRCISEDDRPSEKHFRFGQSLGLDVGPEWGKFKNYCLAHAKRYANFDAAFRNWLANAEAMKGKR